MLAQLSYTLERITGTYHLKESCGLCNVIFLGAYICEPNELMDQPESLCSAQKIS